MSRTRIGIVGYGNLGRGVEIALQVNPDLELVGVFSRRPPEQVDTLSSKAQVFPMNALDRMHDAIDVLILCGGSATDLPEQGPQLAARYNTVDSFDTHARVPEYFAALDAAAKPNQKTAIMSVGWDPGLFSLQRLLGEVFLPQGETFTFWGRGLSQGHSDAVRRVEGVRAGVQYTIPSEEILARVRAGERPDLAAHERHVRHCYVVLEDGANADDVRTKIQTMPHYFADYQTEVTFIDEETLRRDHSSMPHGGYVFRSGSTGTDHSQVTELRIALGSNPEFTASVLVAYARAAARMHARGWYGAHTVLDVPPGMLSSKEAAQLRKELI